MTVTATKERILDAAEELMWQKSFHSVGLSEILKAVNIPKGSFYYWFKSKEDFGVELLKHYIAHATASKGSLFFPENPENGPLDRMLSFFDVSAKHFEESGRRCPCLVLKLASEVADMSEPMREVLAIGLIDWLHQFTEIFEEAKALGEINPDLNSALEGELLRDLWAGAIQRAAILKSAEPLENALHFIKERISSHRLAH